MVERKKKNTGAVTYLLFFLLLLIAVAAAAMLYPVFRDYQKKQARLSELTAEQDRLKRKSAELNAEVAALRSDPKAVEKVAREKFGLVKNGESVYKFEPPEDEPVLKKRR